MVAGKKHDIEHLRKAEEYVNTVLDTIHKIQNGISEEQACKINNIDKSKFRRMILGYTNGYKGQNVIFSENALFLYTEYEKIFAYIMWKNGRWTIHKGSDDIEYVLAPCGDYMPWDIDRSMKYILSTLTEIERDVIKRRAITDITLETLAKQYNCTRERIRQIEAKALRKIRHPSRWRTLTLGITKTEEMKRVHDLAIKQAKEELAKELEEFKTETVADEKLKAIAEMTKSVRNLDNISIDEMCLSVRSRNCLWRGCIYTVGDLSKMTEKNLMHIRNLGKKSFNEIRKVLYEKYGIILKEG